MARFWLHVNHPNNKAIVHADGGCASVRKAVQRAEDGEPYGPQCGDKNGYWEGPFESDRSVEAAQQRTHKKRQDRCGACWR